MSQNLQFQPKFPRLKYCSLWLRHTPNCFAQKAAVEFRQAIIGMDLYCRQKSWKLDPIGCTRQLEHCCHKDIILTGKTTCILLLDTLTGKQERMHNIHHFWCSVMKRWHIHEQKIVPTYIY